MHVFVKLRVDTNHQTPAPAQPGRCIGWALNRGPFCVVESRPFLYVLIACFMLIL